MKGRFATGVAMMATVLSLFAALPAAAGRGGRHGGGYGHYLGHDGWYDGHHGFRSRGYGSSVFVHDSRYYWGPYWGGERPFWGTVLGGITGGVLGSHIGRGAGRTAAIVGGAVLGSMVGGSVGRYMDDVDRLYVARTLESVPSGRVTTWQNPDSRASYEVEPLRTYQRADGRYCREYQTRALVGGEWQQTYGTACRQPDGSWELQR